MARTKGKEKKKKQGKKGAKKPPKSKKAQRVEQESETEEGRALCGWVGVRKAYRLHSKCYVIVESF